MAISYPAEGEFMRVHVTELRVGDRLIANVFNDSGLHVLSNDTILSASDIEKLFRHSVQYVDIAFRSGLDTVRPRPANSPAVSEEMLAEFDSAVNGVKELFQQVAAEGKIDEQLVDEHFVPLSEQFRLEHDVVSLLITLNGKDDYTYQHSVQVGMISYYIAKWLGYSEEEAQKAGKAGYLHDIGKSQIPDEILNKPGKLTEEEYETVKQHTIIGKDIIEKSLQDAEDYALVALQHHERFDGSGYPYGITKERIHPLSNICAVADIYSAMISNRVYREKKNLLDVLRELHRLSFSKIDPMVTQTFIRHMIPNFIGKKVVLKTGEVGVIILNNPTDPFRPLIRIGEQFIDLSQARDLEVDTIQM